MKKFFVIALLVLFCSTAFAQTPTNLCPGLKNPLNFTDGTRTTGAYKAFYSGGTGTKPSTAPNAMSGITGVSIANDNIPGNQLATTTDNGSASYCGSLPGPAHQFRIMSDTSGPGNGAQLGKDPLVSYNLPYCPVSYDTSIHRSIRLGNCQVSAHAEALYYTMKVMPGNALLFIYYSIVVQAPGHGAASDPSFVIRVAKKNNANQWTQITDTLCYAVSSSGLTNNVNGWHSYSGSGGSGFYRDWNKVAINLNNYLFEEVRIEIYMGDCSASGHYGYCYVAGDCQPMQISTSGCPAGASTSVQRLSAPKGLTNYTWERCTSGTQYLQGTDMGPEAAFVAIQGHSGPGDSIYNCQASDFYLTAGDNAGQYVSDQVFRCTMTSAMDPAKPFTSKVITVVTNKKPLCSIDTTFKDCDGRIRLKDNSYVPGMADAIDSGRTEWWIYQGSSNTTPLAATFNGRGKIEYQFDSLTPGRHMVMMRSYTKHNPNDPRDTAECYTDHTIVVNALGRPEPALRITCPNTADRKPHFLCDGQQATLIDNTPQSRGRDWIYEGDTIPAVDRAGNLNNSNSNFTRGFAHYENIIEMRAYNGLYYKDSLDQNVKHYCYNSIKDTIYLFSHPNLVVTGDSVVCNGDKTSMVVSTETDSCTFKWYIDTTQRSIQSGISLTQFPYADTCIYFVKVTSPQGCSAWDSVHAYMVRPTLRIEKLDMCDGDSVRLFAAAADHYTWTAEPADPSLNRLLDSHGDGPDLITVKPHQSTTYTMVGHGTNGCSASPLTKSITVHPLPTAKVSFDPLFVDSADPKVTFNDVSPYSVASGWFFQDAEMPEMGPTITHDFGEVADDSVDVRLIAANDLGCTDTLDFRLPVVLFTFYAPNVFQPERPEENINTFRFYTINQMENFHIYIYDRKGRLMFTSQDLNFAWDGTTMNGQKCPQGTYVYVATYRRPLTEDIVTQKGVVTLIR